jgi:hypothetical protein
VIGLTLGENVPCGYHHEHRYGYETNYHGREQHSHDGCNNGKDTFGNLLQGGDFVMTGQVYREAFNTG